MSKTSTYIENKQRITDLKKDLFFFDQEIDACIRGISALHSDLKARLGSRRDVEKEIAEIESLIEANSF